MYRHHINVISFTIVTDIPSPVQITLAIFKVSRSATRVITDDWMGRTNNKEYPLLLSSVFDNFFNGLPPVDNFNDACIGHFNVTEICLEGFAVLHTRGVAEIEIPLINAGEYHIEVWVGENTNTSQQQPTTTVQDTVYFIDKYDGYNTSVRITPSRVDEVLEVGHLEFWLDYSDEVSYWWGRYFGLIYQSQSWMDMFDYAFYAARPLIDEGGQILEFGVAHGRSLLRLAQHAREWNGGTVVGFDSFRGLPEAWGPKFSSPGLFNMGGIIPERILKANNTMLNIGLFRDTLPLLDWDDDVADTFIAFLHIDCDIYSSALEILTTVGCLLREGSIVVFDELFNMQGTYTSRDDDTTSVSWWKDGEFLALHHSMKLLGLQFKPLKKGIYFEQAVPLVVTKTPTSNTFCDMTRHTMVEAKPSAIQAEDYNALLSFQATAAHIIDRWPGVSHEDLQKVVRGEVDRKTAESILRHVTVEMLENE